MSKPLKIVLLAMSVSGCDDLASPPAVCTWHEVEIQQVAEDQTTMGCIGTNWSTYVRRAGGEVQRLCGNYGDKGTRMKVCLP